MIDDKKVIIIGNSPSVLEYKLGDIIDSYDVVIRINRCITRGFEENIGEKIDIWATTKNSYYEDKFVPENYKDLSYIWHRTPLSKKSLILPEKTNASHYIMFKTSNKLDSYWDKNHRLKKTNHEPCTGLLTILTSTLFYSDVTIHGFTFYGESKGFVTGYYRDSELINGKTHKEDIYWTENKNSGFAGENVANRKQKIIDKLIEDKLIKILNTDG